MGFGFDLQNEIRKKYPLELIEAKERLCTICQNSPNYCPCIPITTDGKDCPNFRENLYRDI